MREDHIAGPVWRLTGGQYVQNCVVCGDQLCLSDSQVGMFQPGQKVTTQEPTKFNASLWRGEGITPREPIHQHLGPCENRVLAKEKGVRDSRDYERLLYYRDRQISNMGQAVNELHEKIQAIRDTVK